MFVLPCLIIVVPHCFVYVGILACTWHFMQYERLQKVAVENDEFSYYYFVTLSLAGGGVACISLLLQTFYSSLIKCRNRNNTHVIGMTFDIIGGVGAAGDDDDDDNDSSIVH